MGRIRSVWSLEFLYFMLLNFKKKFKDFSVSLCNSVIYRMWSVCFWFDVKCINIIESWMIVWEINSILLLLRYYKGIANLIPRSLASFLISPPVWIHWRIARLSSNTCWKIDFPLCSLQKIILYRKYEWMDIVKLKFVIVIFSRVYPDK